MSTTNQRRIIGEETRPESSMADVDIDDSWRENHGEALSPGMARQIINKSK